MAALVLCATAVAGCGSAAPGKPSSATLVLDFTPNPVHAGIYSALANHYDLAAGVRLSVVAPTASTDSIKLLKAGRATFAILDIHDLAIARQQGQDVVGIMAIVQRPLASVLAGPGISRPSQLQGKTAGITGVPSDTAVLDSIVAGGRGNPRRVRTVTIGFNAVPALLSGKVAAATGFWNDEGISLSRRRPGFRAFRVDDYGAPAYPELVLCSTGATLRRHRALAASVVRALIRGYEFTVAHRQISARDLEQRVPGLDPQLVNAELAALLPVFHPAGRAVGELDPLVLRRWSVWETRFGIVRRPPDVQATFDPSFTAPPAGAQ